MAASKFFFVGNALALDLLNPEVVMRGKKRDLLRGFQAMLPDVGVDALTMRANEN